MFVVEQVVVSREVDIGMGGKRVWNVKVNSAKCDIFL